ncbi:flagellar hook-basal body complex protein FliE [Nocardioides pacificus]
MSVPGIEAIGFTPYVPPQVATTDRLDGLASSGGVSGPSGTPQVNQAFGDLLLDGIERLESVQDRSDALAVKAATGDLDNIHDYTTAATEAKVTTQLTVAVRNKAIEAFNEIMRIPIG